MSQLAKSLSKKLLSWTPFAGTIRIPYNKNYFGDTRSLTFCQSCFRFYWPFFLCFLRLKCCFQFQSAFNLFISSCWALMIFSQTSILFCNSPDDLIFNLSINFGLITTQFRHWYFLTLCCKIWKAGSSEQAKWTLRWHILHWRLSLSSVFALITHSHGVQEALNFHHFFHNFLPFFCLFLLLRRCNFI